MNISKKLSKIEWINNNKDLLRPLYHYIQDIQLKKELNKNSILKNKYLNKRCFVFGTGHSLVDVDLSFFKNEYTFGCNSIFLHQSFQEMNLNFYAIIGSIFELWNSPVSWDQPDILFPKVEKAFSIGTPPLLFLDISVKSFIKDKYFTSVPINYVAPSIANNINSLENFDLDRRNDFMIGSHYFLLGTAIYMGFKEIYYLGGGYTYQPIQRCHFYDNDTELEKAKTFMNTPVDERNLDVKRIAYKNGVHIYNVVPEGFQSPIYECSRLIDVYAKIK
jgi:hypothetical protein